MITGRIGLHSALLSLFIHSCSKSVKIKCNTITFFHPAAFECFNAVNPIASAFVEAGHVIALPFASAPTPVVERNGNIFIVTVVITFWVIKRTATFCLFYIFGTNNIFHLF